MKKRFLIPVLALIVIALGITAYLVFSDLAQEYKLKKELSEINELTASDPFNTEALDALLSRTVTKGDYAVVERASKAYLKDSLANISRIAQIIGDEKITQLLSPENFREDGKDFTESISYIESTRTELETCKNKYTEFFTEEKAASYIEDKGLDSYYTELYMHDLIGDTEVTDADKAVTESIDDVISILDISGKVLDLLSQNKDSWYMDRDTIIFSSDELSEQYNALINSL